MATKNTTNEVLGQRLKELRVENGLTIDEFAKAVGISKSAVGYYENDGRMPDAAILTRIADVLNVPADYLLGRTNTAAVKGKMKAVCEITGLSDTSAAFLAELAKDKQTPILSLLNTLLEDYSVDYLNDYNSQGKTNKEKPSSVLNAVIHYLSEYSKAEHSEDFVDYENIARQNKMECAYRQLLLNRVTEAVVDTADNARYKRMGLKRRGRKPAKK